MKNITEAELVTRSHRGTVYICRMCYDVGKKIVIVKYVDGGKREVISTFCDDCVKIMSKCSQCKT